MTKHVPTMSVSSAGVYLRPTVKKKPMCLRQLVMSSAFAHDTCSSDVSCVYDANKVNRYIFGDYTTS